MVTLTLADADYPQYAFLPPYFGSCIGFCHCQFQGRLGVDPKPLLLNR